MRTVRVNTTPGYPVLIGNGILQELVGEYKKKFYPRIPIVVSNQKVFDLWGKELVPVLRQVGWKRGYLIIVPDSEEAKSLPVFADVIKRVADLDKDRKSVLIVAFGGGVVGDLAGFVAGTYRRGVPIVQIPTTLLSQIDSSIGGKTAVNLPSGKNIVGVYHQPALVLIDVRFLSTLEIKQMREGLSEGIKYGIIRSPDLFTYLERVEGMSFDWEWFVEECVKIKARVVSEDERERKGLRFILNLGHTIGHALEIESNHRFSHGQAVALGMVAAGYISLIKGIGSEKTLSRIEGVIDKFGLPKRLGYNVNEDRFWNALVRDKKFSGGRFRFVLPRRIGSVLVSDDVEEREIRSSLDFIRGGI